MAPDHHLLSRSTKTDLKSHETPGLNFLEGLKKAVKLPMGKRGGGVPAMVPVPPTPPERACGPERELR